MNILIIWTGGQTDTKHADFLIYNDAKLYVSCTDIYVYNSNHQIDRQYNTDTFNKRTERQTDKQTDRRNGLKQKIEAAGRQIDGRTGRQTLRSEKRHLTSDVAISKPLFSCCEEKRSHYAIIAKINS